MCASRKKLRLFCSCFPPQFSYCTSRPTLCSAGFPERAGKCFSHLSHAKAVGPSTSSTKPGCRRAGFCCSPATACWAPLGKLCVCALLCPVCPRDGDTDGHAVRRSSRPARTGMGCDTAEAAGGLHGGKRCRRCSTFCLGCGLVVCAGAPWAQQMCCGSPAPLGFFFLLKRIYSPYGELQLREAQLGPGG